MSASHELDVRPVPAGPAEQIPVASFLRSDGRHEFDVRPCQRPAHAYDPLARWSGALGPWFSAAVLLVAAACTASPPVATPAATAAATSGSTSAATGITSPPTPAALSPAPSTFASPAASSPIESPAPASPAPSAPGFVPGPGWQSVLAQIGSDGTARRRPPSGVLAGIHRASRRHAAERRSRFGPLRHAGAPPAGQLLGPADSRAAERRDRAHPRVGRARQYGDDAGPGRGAGGCPARRRARHERAAHGPEAEQRLLHAAGPADVRRDRRTPDDASLDRADARRPRRFECSSRVRAWRPASTTPPAASPASRRNA